ncbi:carbohydrate ABC transporter permease [Streptomyces sp. CG4]|uniref:carbohydrate ABC transporter permease n=1 Tax=Streptomyces sp. CG4 TaxID=408783 RepID=UPI0034E26C34
MTAPAPTARRRSFTSLPLYVTVWLIGVVMVTPLLYALMSGFKSTDQLSGNSFGLPSPWVTKNYTDILKDGAFWRMLGSSTLIAVATTVLTVGAAALAAFALARFAFRGREVLFALFTVGLMFPFAVAILPLFVLLRTFGLLDNPWGVILPQAAFGLPMTVVILRNFFREIPGELEEAATLDGCSAFGFFWRVLLPMARPALGTVSVLAVVTSWNNFLLPLLVFSEPTWWTIPVGVQQFQGQYSSDTARIFAYLVLSMAPALAFYAVAERQLIGGITLGATKG